MPYRITKRGSQHCVVKEDGEVVACHATHQQALKHHRALMANVPDAKELLSAEDAGSLTVYKAQDGSWYWRGIYSNDRWDRDNPPEQLSRQAHEAFIGLLEQELVPYPELWPWHINDSLGKATSITLTDNGFAQAEGYFYPEKYPQAEALSKMNDLGMSHGMPRWAIIRNPDNPNIIDAYYSKELTTLPRSRAANLLTDFQVEESAMALTDEKREFLRGIGYADEQIERFDSLTKEKDTDIVEKGPTQGEGEMPEEVKEEVKEVAPATATVDVKVEVADEKGLELATKSEVTEMATTLAEVLKGLNEQMQAVAQAVQSTGEAVKAVNDRLNALEKTDAEKIKAQVEGTPKQSLADIVRQSVIGQEAAKVDGRTSLAKDAPVETAATKGNVGISFIDDMIAGKDWRESFKTQ